MLNTRNFKNLLGRHTSFLIRGMLYVVHRLSWITYGSAAVEVLCSSIFPCIICCFFTARYPVERVLQTSCFQFLSSYHSYLLPSFTYCTLSFHLIYFLCPHLMFVISPAYFIPSSLTHSTHYIPHP